jgi:hypothetical protein
MSVRNTSFRWCMLIGAGALLGVALYYGFGYIGLNIAVGNSGLKPFYQQTMRALWLGYCLQACLLGLLFTVAAVRPHWISRPLLVICGLLPLAEGVLALSFAGNYWLMILLFCAGLFILVGAALWPNPIALAAPAAATPTPAFTSSTGPLP